MAADVKVRIVTTDDGFVVHWTRGGARQPAGLVPVRTQKQAEDLRDGLERGLAPASAIYFALMPRKRKPTSRVKVATLGGHARAAKLTPEQRSEISRKAYATRVARAAAAAGNTDSTTNETREEVN